MERDKHLLMVAGVSFFMVLIIVLWFFNMGSALRVKQIQSGNNTEDVKMEEVKTELVNAWHDLQEQLEQTRNADKEEATTSPQKTPSSTSREVLSASSSQKLEDIKKNLKKNIGQEPN